MSDAYSFVLPGFCWAIPIAFNMKALQLLNPETCVIFRICSTAGVGIGDIVFFQAVLSTPKKISIAFMIFGSFVFASGNFAVNLLGYFYATLYMISFVATQLLVKGAFNKSKSLSTWCKAFYLNLFGSIPLFLLSCCFERNGAIDEMWELPKDGATYVTGSMFLGISISYVGNSVRDLLSATSFDVLGNVGKILTFMVSAFIFKTEYSSTMFFGSVITLAAGTLYSEHIELNRSFSTMFSRHRVERRSNVIIFCIFVITFCLLLWLVGRWVSKIFSVNWSVPMSISSNSTYVFEERAKAWFKKQEELKKFIVVRPLNGLGNAIHTISSAFLLAILLDRALVIDWDGCAWDAFGTPLVNLCIQNVATQNPHFLSTYRRSTANKEVEFTATVCLKVRCDRDKRFAHNRKAQEALRFGHFPLLACGNLEDYWPGDLFFLKSEVYFVGFLYMNPLYIKKLHAMFPSTVTVYSTILNFLFRLTPEMQQRVDYFAEKHMRGGECVSVFVRTTGFSGSIQENLQLFYDPLEAKQLLGPQHSKCLRWHVPGSSTRRIFLASMYKDVKSHFTKEFGAQVVSFDEVLEPESKNNANLYAVMDMWLLSRCKYAIYSYTSTFGQVSRALSKRPQTMFQTSSPTLMDGLTPIVDGQRQTLYRVSGVCKQHTNREGCSAVYVRWKNRGFLQSFYAKCNKIGNGSMSYPAAFDHGNIC